MQIINKKITLSFNEKELITLTEFDDLIDRLAQRYEITLEDVGYILGYITSGGARYKDHKISNIPLKHLLGLTTE